MEPGEGRIVVWSGVTLFLIEWASVAVSNASDAMFLKRVGIEYLPIVFLVNSVLLTGTTWIAGRVALRLDHRRLLAITFVVLAALLGLLWMLVLAGVPGIPTTLILASKQIEVIASLMFWTVIGSLLTSRQGKRLVALMTAGGTLGTILGSFSSGLFGRALGTASLLAVAVVAFLLAALATLPLARARRHRLLRQGSRTILTELQDQQGNVRAFWRDSALFRVLVGTSFLAGVLGPMLYFEFSFAADLATRTADGEQDLLGIYGLLRGWINVGVLAVQVGGSAWLFRRIGVPLAAVLAPSAYLMGFAGLSVKFGLPSAMPATMGTSIIDHTIYEPAQRILSALLPPRIRTAATSVIQGPAKRGGAALGSFLILVVVYLGEPDQVAYVALPIAALWTILAWRLWSQYPNLLLEAASVRHGESEDEEAMNGFLDASTMRNLQRYLEGDDPGFCRAACELMIDAPPVVAVDALTKALATDSPHRSILLATLDEVLTAAGPTLPTSRRAVASIVRTLGDTAAFTPLEHGKQLQILGRASAGRVVSDEARSRLEFARRVDAPVVRTAAAMACMRNAVGGASMDDFDGCVIEALESGDPECRAVALGELRFELLRGDDQSETWKKRLRLLADHLRAAGPSPAAQDRAAACASTHGCTQAVSAIADIAQTHPAAVAEVAGEVLALVNDPDPVVRAAVLRFIGNANLVDRAGVLGERLSSRVSVESHAARRALEQLGPAAVHALLHALRHGGRRGREIVPLMLKEIRPDGQLLVMLIDREIEVCRSLILVLGALDASDISRLVLQRLRERIDESSRVVLELLAALLDDDRVARVCRSLGRSWNVRDRAVLLEALEALLPPLERDRILPILEDHGAQRLAATAAQALGRRFPTMEEALAQALASRDALTTALIAATVDRSLLARLAPHLDVDAVLRLFSPRRALRKEPGVEGPDAVQEVEPMLSPVETMLHLRALDLFEGLTTAQLSELARVVTEVVVPDGEDIISEGEFDDSMYFIVDGTVKIIRGGNDVATLGARDFFGEMAAFDGETRSATARAVGTVRLLCLARIDLFEVMEDLPAIGIGICQTLAKRLRTMLRERSAELPRG